MDARDQVGFVSRAAGPADASTAGRMLFDFNTEFEAPTPSADELAGRFERLLGRDDVLVLLARPDGEASTPDPAGFAFVTVRPSAYCDAGVAQLEELYVVPALRGRGAGTVLLQDLFARTRELGVDEIQVNVDSVDVDARRFYERHGFTNFEVAGPGQEAATSRMLLYVREE